MHLCVCSKKKKPRICKTYVSVLYFYFFFENIVQLYISFVLAAVLLKFCSKGIDSSIVLDTYMTVRTES